MDPNYVGAITDLLKWGISAGLSAAEARKTLKANGIDEAEYAHVIDDKRTFEDFHGTNPQAVGAPPPVDDHFLGTWYPNPNLSDDELRALFTRGLKYRSTDGRFWAVTHNTAIDTDPNGEPAIDDGVF